MKKAKSDSEISAILRQKAEMQLKMKTAQRSSQLSEADTLKLIHELEVHQIELELQKDELVLAREKAELSAEKHAALYDFAPSGYFTLTREGIIAELNLCGAQMLGTDRSHLVNKYFESYISDDTKPAYHLFWEKVLSGQTQESCEAVLFVGGRSTTDVHLCGIASENGKQCFVSAVDITAHKRAEEALRQRDEKFRTLATLAPVGIYLNDPDGNCQYANPEWCKMAGLSLEEARGQGWKKGLHPDDRDSVFSHWNRMVESGGQWGHEYRLMTGDGKVTWVYGLAAPQYDDHGKILMYVGVNQDITLQKLIGAEREKSEMQRNQMQKLESLGVLAAGIAHDFNNLMAAIFGYIELAGKETKNKNASQYLSKAVNTMDRARSLTQQLLTFAKGGAPDRKIGSLLPFIRETAQFALSGANVSCHFDIPQDLWACYFDKNQISQVIDNLIINAQQAMPLGGTIELNARNVSLAEKEHPVLAKGDYLKISVKDRGIGMPKELISRIFDPFFTTKAKGHGLGLTTCYSIVNRHGGCIEAESEQGKGSVFKVYLPASVDSFLSVPDTSANRHKGSGTFLVMDDEEAIRDILGDMLEALGYSVVRKGNGKEAIDFFAAEAKANRSIAAMIFDLTVPGGMGGKEAIEAVRKWDSKIPVFVASGYADDPVMKNPADYGFTASLCKPFKKTELTEMLSKYLKVNQSGIPS